MKVCRLRLTPQPWKNMALTKKIIVPFFHLPIIHQLHIHIRIWEGLIIKPILQSFISPLFINYQIKLIHIRIREGLIIKLILMSCNLPQHLRNVAFIHYNCWYYLFVVHGFIPVCLGVPAIMRCNKCIFINKGGPQSHISG